MSKVLYIGVFKDMSGYASAARNYAQALDRTGVDLVLRAVRYDISDPGTEPDILNIKHLLKKKTDNITTVITHVTPNEMRLCDNPGIQNIAMTTVESSEIPEYWAAKLNKFDKIITFCNATKEAFIHSGVTKPVFVVPHCFNLPYSLDGIKPLRVGNEDLDLSKRFIFYNISQLSHKKGLDALLRAYYRAFWQSPDEVFLVLKTYVNMGNRSKDLEIIVNFVNEVKAGMRLPKYPEAAILTGSMTDEELRRLHKMGSCYVSSSRSEGFNIPAFEALAYGNKLVCPTHTGHESYATKSNCFNFESQLTPLFNQQHPDPVLFTSKGLWYEPNMLSLEKALVDAKNTVMPSHTPDLSEFSFDKIGQELVRVINL